MLGLGRNHPGGESLHWIPLLDQFLLGYVGISYDGDRTGIGICTDIAISAYYFCILKILCTLY